MSAGERREPRPKRLLAVRLGAMGDIIHTLPAVTMLRRAFPDAEIGWMVEERWAELLCAKDEPRSGPVTAGRPLVNFVHAVNTKVWRKSPLAGATRRQFSSALKEVRDRDYDIAVDFQGAIKSALLARLSGAQSVWGMQKPRETPARLFYSRQVETTGVHVIEQYQSLADALAGEFGGKEDSRPSLGYAAESSLAPANQAAAGSRRYAIEFPADAAAETAIAQQFDHAGKEIVLINPGAGWRTKEWPAERYGAVARTLAQEGFFPLINYGPGEEQLARAVESASGGSARSISCSVGELIALTRRARLLIGGDTGPLHLAAALGVPVVAIFGPTDRARNGPYSANSVVLRNPASKTSLSHTSTPDPGLQQITVDQVLAAAHQLLEANG